MFKVNKKEATTMFERGKKITYRSIHSHDVFPTWRQLVEKYFSGKPVFERQNTLKTCLSSSVFSIKRF